MDHGLWTLLLYFVRWVKFRIIDQQRVCTKCHPSPSPVLTNDFSRCEYARCSRLWSEQAYPVTICPIRLWKKFCIPGWWFRQLIIVIIFEIRISALLTQLNCDALTTLARIILTWHDNILKICKCLSQHRIFSFFGCESSPISRNLR